MTLSRFQRMVLQSSLSATANADSSKIRIKETSCFTLWSQPITLKSSKITISCSKTVTTRNLSWFKNRSLTQTAKPSTRTSSEFVSMRFRSESFWFFSLSTFVKLSRILSTSSIGNRTHRCFIRHFWSLIRPTCLTSCLSTQNRWRSCSTKDSPTTIRVTSQFSTWTSKRIATEKSNTETQSTQPSKTTRSAPLTKSSGISQIIRTSLSHHSCSSIISPKSWRRVSLLSSFLTQTSSRWISTMINGRSLIDMMARWLCHTTDLCFSWSTSTEKPSVMNSYRKNTSSRATRCSKSSILSTFCPLLESTMKSQMRVTSL